MAIQKSLLPQSVLKSLRTRKPFMGLFAYLTALYVCFIVLGVFLFTGCTNLVNVDESHKNTMTSAKITSTAESNNINCTKKKCVLAGKCTCRPSPVTSIPIEMEPPSPPANTIELVMNRVRGAITARYSTRLTGSVVIDGRNHDTFDNLVGTGVFGVYTSGIMDLYGRAMIGGNGIAPVTMPNPTVCKENAPEYSYYSSPEAFLGLDEGSLDAYKIPASEFTTPFEGVVYVTDELGPVNFVNSRGILIVHNQLSDAKLTLISGRFKGLIICDVMHRINGVPVILGAVVTLSGEITSRFGNGYARIHYSSETLEELPSYCDIFTN